MTFRDFCFWLDGVISGKESLNEDEILLIKETVVDTISKNDSFNINNNIYQTSGVIPFYTSNYPLYISGT